jgi:hypothetical protein
VSETTIAFVLDAAAMLLALLIALGAMRLGAAQFHLLAPADAEAVPVFHMSALMAGLVCGFALLVASPHLDAFAPRQIFAADSPWSIDLRQFLASYALPPAAAFDALGNGLRGDAGWLLTAVAWLAVASILFGCFAALRFWRGWTRLRALLAFLVLAAWIALLMGYIVNLAAWVAAHLSFWIFLLLLVALQRWRHGSRSAAH